MLDKLQHVLKTLENIIKIVKELGISGVWMILPVLIIVMLIIEVGRLSLKTDSWSLDVENVSVSKWRQLCDTSATESPAQSDDD